MIEPTAVTYDALPGGDFVQRMLSLGDGEGIDAEIEVRRAVSGGASCGFI